MLGIFGRKKIGEEQLAQIFVNAMISMSQEAFPDIAELVNDDPEFVKSPELSPEGYVPFLFVVVAGNLKSLPRRLDGVHAKHVLMNIYAKLAVQYDTSASSIEQHIKKYQSELSRLNHPSKNIVYGMSKLFFHLYDLYPFQNEYYTRIQAQNPIILKRIDSVMNAFLWNWDSINDEYKIVS
jgi:hypothetical protein